MNLTENADAAMHVSDALSAIGAALRSFQDHMDDLSPESQPNPFIFNMLQDIYDKELEVSQQFCTCRDFCAEAVVASERAHKLESIVAERDAAIESLKRSTEALRESQQEALRETESQYGALLRLEQSKMNTVEERAAQVVTAARVRRLKQYVLFTWMKKAMVQSISREVRETQLVHQGAADHMARQYLTFCQEHRQKSRLLHTWRLKTAVRQQKKLQDEADCHSARFTALEEKYKALEHFVENDVEDEKRRCVDMLRTACSERDRLEEETTRLKIALDELTTEFSERTSTYFRQQEETEQFHKSCEEKLKYQVRSLCGELEAARSDKGRLAAETAIWTERVTSFYEDSASLGAQYTDCKQKVFEMAVTSFGCQSALSMKEMQDRCADLQQTVEMLSDVGESNLALRGENLELARLTESFQEANTRLCTQLCQSKQVCALLTDELQEARDALSRQHAFLSWSLYAAERGKGRAAEEYANISGVLMEHKKKALMQVQELKAVHTETQRHLSSACEDEKRKVVALEGEVDRLRKQRTELDELLGQSQQEGNTLAEQCAELISQNQQAQRALCAVQRDFLHAQEDRDRQILVCDEARTRLVWQQRSLLLYKVEHRELSWRCKELCTSGAEAKRQSEKLTTSHRRAAQVKQRESASALERAVLYADTLVHFTRWADYASRRRSERKQASDHRISMQQCSESADEKVRTTLAECDAQLAAHNKQLVSKCREYDEQIAALHSCHASTLHETTKRHDSELSQLRHALEEAGVSLNGVGEQVVEYCARSAFKHWQLLSAIQKHAREERRLQALCQEQRAFFVERDRLVGDYYAQSRDLFLFEFHKMSDHHAENYEVTLVSLQHENTQLCSALEERQRFAEEEMDALRNALHSQQQRYLAEKEYTTVLQARFSEEYAASSLLQSLCTRYHNLVAVSGAELCFEHSRECTDIFSTACVNVIARRMRSLTNSPISSPSAPSLSTNAENNNAEEGMADADLPAPAGAAAEAAESQHQHQFLTCDESSQPLQPNTQSSSSARSQVNEEVKQDEATLRKLFTLLKATEEYDQVPSISNANETVAELRRIALDMKEALDTYSGSVSLSDAPMGLFLRIGIAGWDWVHHFSAPHTVAKCDVATQRSPDPEETGVTREQAVLLCSQMLAMEHEVALLHFTHERDDLYAAFTLETLMLEEKEHLCNCLWGQYEEQMDAIREACLSDSSRLVSGHMAELMTTFLAQLEESQQAFLENRETDALRQKGPERQLLEQCSCFSENLLQQSAEESEALFYSFINELQEKRSGSERRTDEQDSHLQKAYDALMEKSRVLERIVGDFEHGAEKGKKSSDACEVDVGRESIGVCSRDQLRLLMESHEAETNALMETVRNMKESRRREQSRFKQQMAEREQEVAQAIQNQFNSQIARLEEKVASLNTALELLRSATDEEKSRLSDMISDLRKENASLQLKSTESLARVRANYQAEIDDLLVETTASGTVEPNTLIAFSRLERGTLDYFLAWHSQQCRFEDAKMHLVVDSFSAVATMVISDAATALGELEETKETELLQVQEQLCRLQAEVADVRMSHSQRAKSKSQRSLEREEHGLTERKEANRLCDSPRPPSPAVSSPVLSELPAAMPCSRTHPRPTPSPRKALDKDAPTNKRKYPRTSAGSSGPQCRMRSRSLDSIDVSQSLLRYSEHLHSQTERNDAALARVDDLLSEVDDLIRRGESLRALSRDTSLISD